MMAQWETHNCVLSRSVRCLGEYPVPQVDTAQFLPSFRTSTDSIRRPTSEIPTCRGIRARFKENAQIPIGANAGNRRLRVCCLWGMLLSLHTAVKEFRNRYRQVGHGKCGRMQPAVVAQHAVQHAYAVANHVWLWSAAVYCKSASASLRPGAGQLYGATGLASVSGVRNNK
jgi:hypothetical protein